MPRKKIVLPVYEAEAKAGLAEEVKASASMAYITQLTDKDVSQEVAKDFFSKASNTEDEEQFDLFYLNTILVTTGWNLNDDIFDKSEVWNARYTPAHKMFNLEHDPSRIIGHMTNSIAVDEEYKALAADTTTETLPAKFHLLTGAVLYRYYSNAELQEQIDKIIDEIGEGKWYVSMECLFRNFDYGLKDAEGSTMVVARNEETAFLTKYLKRYGGNGSFEHNDKNYSIGRVLRNFTFSGKGLVANPANPESLIFNKATSIFIPTLQTLGYIQASEDNSIQENKEMAEKLETQVAELTDKLTVANDQLTKANQTVADKDAVIAQKDEQIKELTDKLSETNTSLKDAQTEVANLKTAQANRERLALVVSKGSTKEEAERLVSLFSDKDDKQFAELVDLFVKSSVPTEPKEKEKEDVKSDASLNVDEVGEDVKRANLRTSLASLLGDVLETNDDQD